MSRKDRSTLEDSFPTRLPQLSLRCPIGSDRNQSVSIYQHSNVGGKLLLELNPADMVSLSGPPLLSIGRIRKIGKHCLSLQRQCVGSWNVPLEACMQKGTEDSSKRGAAWPERLETVL
ncbi:hypothetical protein DY000_02029584 [Brassica cretica]|uniref:Uncharacterized protein n=1 Tax=Brassica cretica TaxID=69181 RepID=A0ABQ7DPZ1_BRACR|nr:hypothetical protein DY000_02029584 [Brassica cretica]